jgi:hypothetical protein
MFFTLFAALFVGRGGGLKFGDRTLKVKLVVAVR